MTVVFLRTITLEFIAGMILAHVLVRPHGRVPPLWAAVAVVVSAIVMFAWGTRHGIYLPGTEKISRAIFYGIPALGTVAAIVQMDLQHQWRWFAKLAPLGDRSYAIYLVHLPIIAAFYRFAGKLSVFHSPAGPVLEIICLTGLLFLSVEILHRMVEKPAHASARRMSAWLLGKKPKVVSGESLPDRSS